MRGDIVLPKFEGEPPQAVVLEAIRDVPAVIGDTDNHPLANQERDCHAAFPLSVEPLISQRLLVRVVDEWVDPAFQVVDDESVQTVIFEGVDEEALARLRSLADEAETRSERWSESTDEVALSAYARLRAEACALAQSQGLAVGDEFEALVPTVAGLQTLQALEPYEAGMGLSATESVKGAPVQRALRRLAAWAIGVRMAGELRL